MRYFKVYLCEEEGHVRAPAERSEIIEDDYYWLSEKYDSNQLAEEYLVFVPYLCRACKTGHYTRPI